MYGFEVYTEEFVKPLFMSLELLERANINFWAPEVCSLKQSWHLFYMIPSVIFHYITLTTNIMKMFTDELDPFEKADLLPLWLANNQFWFETAILIMERDKIRQVIIHLGSAWRVTELNEKQLKMKEAVLKRLYYGGIALNKVALAVAWQYLLVPLLETAVRRLHLNQDVDFKLPFALEYPFEIKEWPVYLALYAFEVYSTFRIIYVYQGVNWLLIVLTQGLHVQFLLLQEDLVHIKPVANGKPKPVTDDNLDEVIEEGPNMRLGDFVKRHQHVILLADELNMACKKLTFIIMLFATLIICFFAVAAKASTGLAYAVNNCGVIVTTVMNTFVLCYCSQTLSSSSSGIADAAANNLWYKGDLRYQTDIRFIMMRSQKPCSLTSLDFMPIGLDTFNKVVKTTWSYFSLASHIYDRRD